ncbi:ricin-type beta-trefoil lectin domain protein [Streptomyces katrae]|uniref:Ricin-type beta-trefoil lectin domain protein n=1 Tax=Streptomyces katrae TaxID=68223 RepID=A0ABT7GQR4_9ACTN|nr:ricin-type beta-trefoil lectin domain protein [Streptomyces katrae]MDK9495229.1 ricin-type beta-trefoil lectin domain protein [Streptomyces katrae]
MSVMLMATLLPVQAWAASPGDRSGVQLPGLQQDMKAKLDKVEAAKLEGWAGAPVQPPPDYEPSKATPPAGGTAPVTLTGEQLVQAGALPVSIGKASPTPENPAPPTPSGTWSVAVETRTATEAANVDGALIKVTPPVDAATPVDVQLDYKKFKDLYGTEWATRLELKQLPSCFLETPNLPECSVAKDVPSTNDPATGTVRATVDPANAPSQGMRTMAGGSGGPMVLAASDGASGAGGTYKATSLSPSGSWTAGGSGGGFSWSYPLTVPAPPAGPAPQIGFSYSSQAVDGRTSVANGQASWIGDGWGYEPGFIERRYRSCSDDRKASPSTPNNDNATDKKKGDLCWAGDNVVMSLGGSTSELVRDSVTGQWVPSSDDGSRIERKTDTTVANGAKDGEYWVVTTRDGTRYFFGRHDVDGAGSRPVTNSVLTVPVFGNHPGEPCYQTSYAASSCEQGWRWNLDYVEDVHGNAMIIDWAKETNRYAKNQKYKEAVSYVRAGYPTQISYGLRSDNLSGPPAAQVEFTVAERCIKEGVTQCSDAEFEGNNYGGKQPWWDTPATLNCKPSATDCYVPAPSFWTRKRLTAVTTKAQRTEGSTALSLVDRWTLAQSFPRQRTDTHPPLWLESITRTGYSTAKDSGGNQESIALPPVSFLANVQDMPNRVATSATDATPGFDRLRVETIRSETGGEIVVDYSAPCPVGGAHPKPEENTTRCFPVHWTPDGELEKPPLEWFNKYVVEKVTEKDRVARQPDVTTSYTYEGDAAWAKDNDEFSKPELRTYSQWRGYASVVVNKGVTANAGKPDATEQSQTRTRFFRGMSGDASRPKITLKDSTGAEDLGEDVLQLQGQAAETITYTKAGGEVSSRVLNWPWLQKTASRPRDGTTPLEAYRSGTARTDAMQAVSGGRTYLVRTRHTFDTTYGLPQTTQAEVLTPNGTGWSSSNQQCVATTYVHNTAKHLIGLTQRTRTTIGDCTQTAWGEVISDVRASFDVPNAFGATPDKGLPVQGDTLDAAGTGWITQTRTEYDALGRPTKNYDAAGNATSTSYSPATGSVFATTITNALGHAVTTKSDPGRGSVLESLDANSRKVTSAYDALGRTTGVWTPSRKQGTDKAAYTFSYQITEHEPPTVTSNALKDDGSYTQTITLYDGQLRPRQTQGEALGGGRLITDTLYNTSGVVRQTNNSYYAEGEPDKKLFVPESVFHVPNSTKTAYDGLGRVTQATTLFADVPQYSSTTQYGGDFTLTRSAMSVDGTTPLKGSRASKTWTDPMGRTSAVEHATAADLTTWNRTSYNYDVRNKLSQVTDAAGNKWTYGYDARGRKTWSEDPDTGRSEFGYNNLDQQLWAKDSSGRTQYTTYDVLGRTTELRDDAPNGPLVASFTFDTLTGAKGQPVASTRYEGGAAYTSEVTGYDSEYRPTGSKITIPNVPATKGLAGTYAYSTTYTPTGKIQSSTLPSTPGGLAAEKLVTRYDREGMPQTLSGLAWYTADIKYSPFGDVLRTASGSAPNRIWTTNLYNPNTGQVTNQITDRETGPNRISDVSYDYDVAGNITSITDTQPGGRVDRQCYTYDQMGQLTKAWTGKTAACTGPSLADVTPGPDGDGFWQEYQFDAIGNRTKLVNKDLTNSALDDETTYTYGVTIATNGAQPPLKTQPHALSKAEKTTRNPGSTVTSLSTYEYDASGNTKSRRIDGDTQTLNWDRRNKITSAGSPGIGAVSVIGASGKCIDVESGGTADGTPVQIYPCNETKAQQWRLTGETVRALDKCLTTSGSKLVLATCDGTDKQKFVHRAGDKSLNNPATNQCVDVPNNAADGTDLQLWPCNATDPQQFTFDNTTTYIYDAGGNRLIEETGSSRTLYLGEAEITVNKAGQAIDAVRYYSGAGATTVRRTTGKADNHQLTVQLADHHGTATTSVEQTAGQAITRRKSDPYGNPRGTQPGNWTGNRGFLGSGIDDTNTGLTHIGAREYEATTGRFISVDPIIDITDPLQMNGYTYANGNPIGGSDPSGLFCDGCSVNNPDSVWNPDHLGQTRDWDFTDPTWDYGRNGGKPKNNNKYYYTSSRGDGPKAPKDTNGTVKIYLINRYIPTQDELVAFNSAFYKPKQSYEENIRLWANNLCGSSYEPGSNQEFCDGANAIGLINPSGDWMEALGIRNIYECSKDFGWNKNCGMAAVDIVITVAGGIAGRAAKGAKAAKSAEVTIVEEGTAPKFITQCDSFTAGTLVLMADGTVKNIEDVKIGEEVIATDPQSGETASKTVTSEIFTEDDKDYIELTVKGQDRPITTTTHHPFWSASDASWVDAGELKPGATLRTDAGTTVGIASVHRYRADQQTYNLTVSDLHTYYVLVGETPVLVHNANRRSTCGIGGDGDSYYGDGRPGPYERPPGTPTAEQRASVQGKPCVTCGASEDVMFADHKVPLVTEWFNRFKINMTRAKSVDAVQPQCGSCSGAQGGKFSHLARKWAKAWGFDD